MKPFQRGILNGSPWFAFKESSKAGSLLTFVFRIDEYQYFILHEICVFFPCGASGNTRLPLKVSVQSSSTQNLFTPVPVLPELFSSPSQNFRQGTLNEEVQGVRLIPVTLNYPFDKGDTVTVEVSGADTGFVVGCMLAGRKYGGKYGS